MVDLLDVMTWVLINACQYKMGGTLFVGCDFGSTAGALNPHKSRVQQSGPIITRHRPAEQASIFGVALSHRPLQLTPPSSESDAHSAYARLNVALLPKHLRLDQKWLCKPSRPHGSASTGNNNVTGSPALNPRRFYLALYSPSNVSSKAC